MNTFLVLAIFALIVAAVALLLYFLIIKKAKELKSKTAFAVQSEELMKVTFDGQSTLKSISIDFNALVDKYLLAKGDKVLLEKDRDDKKELGDKVKEFEHYLSQSNLLSEIGKKITGSLNVNDIMSTVYEYVRSSMDIEELELLYYENEVPQSLSVGEGAKSQIKTHKLDELPLVFKWTLENKKPVFLNDAKRDYSQYFFEPIKSFTQKSPEALIGVPLFLNERPIGAIGVYSLHKEVYTEYHLSFLKTLATYLAVALDNSNVYRLLENSKVEIEEEKAKSEELLLNILPSEIAEELKETGEAPARHYDNVAILFSDFKEFTVAAASLTATELVDEVNVCFKAFDLICEKYNVEKIKTIGDSYMAVGGLPIPFEKDVLNTVLAGLEMAEFIVNRKKEVDSNAKVAFDMRLGIHSGPVVAGIVGVKKFQYDLWGDAVNTASRMESHGEIGKVNVSKTVYEHIKDTDGLSFESRGKIDVRGKGEIEMFFVSKKS